MYDVAVLGSGPGGYVAALRAAMRGAKTCIIEEKYIGGTCLNVGCIPTKAMLHGSELFWHMRHAEEYGFSIGQTARDDAKFMKRTTKVVSQLTKGVEFLLKKRGVDIIRGRGELTGNDTLSVAGPEGAQEIKAKNIILATGSQPVKPGFIPWDSDRIITTNEATTAAGLPKSILILGGGVIGCEFATVYGELGIETTLVEMLDKLVANMDNDIARAITASLKKRGVKVLTGCKVTSMSAANSTVKTEIEGGQIINSDMALIAIGRQSNIQGIGLEKIGINVENGIIVVDEYCRTNIEGIYAIGDAAEKMQFAHLASRMGIIAADNATGHPASDRRDVVPVGIYTHPEVASVGLSEESAKEQTKNVKIARFTYKASGMAQAYGQTEGMVKLIAEAEHGAILGAVVIGPHATDVIQEIALAQRNELTIEEIAWTIHPHPTFAEAVGEAAEAWLGLPLHQI